MSATIKLTLSDYSVRERWAAGGVSLRSPNTCIPMAKPNSS